MVKETNGQNFNRKSRLSPSHGRPLRRERLWPTCKKMMSADICRGELNRYLRGLTDICGELNGYLRGYPRVCKRTMRTVVRIAACTESYAMLWYARTAVSCLQNDGFCTGNAGFCTGNDGFCTRNAGFLPHTAVSCLHQPTHRDRVVPLKKKILEGILEGILAHICGAIGNICGGMIICGGLCSYSYLACSE